MSQATLGMPVWVAIASGTLTAANDGVKMAATFVATLAATAIVAQVIPPIFHWFRQGRRGWGVAVALAMASGAGLVAVAGARLGARVRRHGAERPRLRGSHRTARPRLAGRRLGAALRARCSRCTARSRAAGCLPAGVEPALAGDGIDELPAGMLSRQEQRAGRRGLPRIPGLTVRPAARGRARSASTAWPPTCPDRNAFARWLDQTIAHARLSETGCAVLLIHIADFREVDEVFEVRADDILAQDAGALAQAALEPHDFLARLARDEFAGGRAGTGAAQPGA